MSLNPGELRDLVRNKIHVDEYDSKMGKNPDIVTISFKIKYQDPAQDLVNFLEKGYDWILDSDVSAGTVSDGSWIVFIETLRRPSLTKKLFDLLEDLESLTRNDPDDYVFSYKTEKKYIPLTPENFEDIVPLTPREYRRRQKPEKLDHMLSAAGMAPKKSQEYNNDVKEFVNLSKL